MISAHLPDCFVLDGRLMTSLMFKRAPNFNGTAVVDGEYKFIQLSDFEGGYLVLFFYPLD